LVEPGVSLVMRGIAGATDGTVDTFGQLDDEYDVFIDADADGAAFTVAVAETEFSTPQVFSAHRRWFHENLRTQPDGGISSDWGAFVTRLDRDGHRLHSTYVDTPYASELHGLRTVGDATYVLGRMRRTDDGNGYDAFVASVDAASLVHRWFSAVDV